MPDEPNQSHLNLIVRTLYDQAVELRVIAVALDRIALSIQRYEGTTKPEKRGKLQ